MFQKLFGPFPDEPLLYGVDKLLGLYTKFVKNKKTNAANLSANQIQSIDPNDGKNCVVSEKTTTKNEVIKTQEVDSVNLFKSISASILIFCLIFMLYLKLR